VDDLIVDEDPTGHYVTDDGDKSSEYAKLMEAVHKGRGPPAGTSEQKRRMYE
jgi:hypothetical protein